MRASLSVSAIAAGLLCFALTAHAQSSGSVLGDKGSGSIYITHVTVIDTETGKESRGQTVVISDDRISEVTDSKKVKPAAGAKVVDGTGKYLIPGLWDMHVHSWEDDSTYPLYIANGITGVRDMFGPPDANKFRADLKSKGIPAPHFYVASPIIDGNPPRWSGSIVVSTPEEARRVVDEQKQKGADFIKVYDRLSRDAYFAILDEGKQQKITVVGHVPFAISAWEAAAAGQKTFEHLNGIPVACSTREEKLWPQVVGGKSFKERNPVYLQAWRSYNDEKCRHLFEELKKNAAWAVPTLVVARSGAMRNDSQFTQDDRSRFFRGATRDWLEGKPDTRYKDLTGEDFRIARELLVSKKDLTGAMFRAGVRLLAGTDAGNPFCFPGFSLHDELALLVESGMTPLGALQAATSNAAVFMDATDKYGSVSPGRIADLVLLDADPLQDIHNTTRISAVFLSGRYLDRAALDKLLKDAEAAASSASEVKVYVH